MKTCFFWNAALARRLKDMLLEALPPSYCEEEYLWAPGMTLDDLQLNTLLAVFSKYLGTFATVAMARRARQVKEQPTEYIGDDKFAQSFSNVVKSYTGLDFSKTTG